MKDQPVFSGRNYRFQFVELKNISSSNGVTQMAMWKRIAIFYEEKYADRRV